MKANQDPEPNPNELAQVQILAARKAAAETAGKLLTDAIGKAASIRHLEIESLNTLREAGQQFNIASGRKQLVFDLAGVAFTRKYILPHLPPAAKIEHVRLAVHLANTLPAPISTPEELRAVKREVQLMLTLFGLADAPRRKELQSAHAHNYFAEFTDRVATMGVLLEKLEAEAPIDSWRREKLEEFLEDAKPLRQAIARAERALLGHTPSKESFTTKAP